MLGITEEVASFAAVATSFAVEVRTDSTSWAKEDTVQAFIRSLVLPGTVAATASSYEVQMVVHQRASEAPPSRHWLSISLSSASKAPGPCIAGSLRRSSPLLLPTCKCDS